MSPNVLIIIFLISIVGINIYIPIAKKYGIVDVPNNRSSHEVVTVRGLGIIFIVIIPALYFLNVITNLQFTVGLVAMSCLGFLDDILSLRASLRLAGYLAAILLCYYSFDFIDYSLPVIILVIIGLIGTINAYNFMDGINGITLLYSIVSLISLVILGLNLDSGLYSLTGYTSILIVLILLGYYNIRQRAIAFIGDSGSIVIGAIISIGVLLLIFKSGYIGYLALLLVYGVESVGTIIYRLIKRENIFNPHRLHIYQKLVNEKKMSHLSVAIFYSLLQLVINLSLFFYSDFINPLFLVWLVILSITYVLSRIYYLDDLKFSTIL